MRSLVLLGVLAAVAACGDDTGGGGTGGSGAGGGATATTGSTGSSSTESSSSTGGPSDADTAADERYCGELCECDDFPTTGPCQETCVESQALDRADFAGSPCEAEANAWFSCQTSEAECVDGATMLGNPDCAAVTEALDACQDANP
jgi:hypothetical protein